jgi:hypothetical protein
MVRCGCGGIMVARLRIGRRETRLAKIYLGVNIWEEHSKKWQ